MSKQMYSDETKAAAMSALLTGQSVNSVAREYKIPKGTVSSWKNRGTSLDATQKTEIGDLILAYLRVSLQTMIKQAEFFADEEWLKKQTASDVAVLHGVHMDKIVRLIEASAKENKDDAPGRNDPQG